MAADAAEEAGADEGGKLAEDDREEESAHEPDPEVDVSEPESTPALPQLDNSTAAKSLTHLDSVRWR